MMMHGGGRAGVHVGGWLSAGYNLEDLESLRQKLLRRNDIGSVQRAMRQVGLTVHRASLHLVKRYNFDSRGIGFRHENYEAWHRLTIGKGTIGDAAYIVHEIAETEELQRIRQQTGFDFMGKGVKKLARKARRQWKTDFNHYYRLSHSKALKAEYEFVIKEVNRYIREPKLKITMLQAAAIDPTRYVDVGAKETEAARHMFVDGVAMKKHHHYHAWHRRTNELVPLTKKGERKLRKVKAPGTDIRVDDLIRLVRHQRIK